LEPELGRYLEWEVGILGVLARLAVASVVVVVLEAPEVRLLSAQTEDHFYRTGT
jgi:hypothetical protein